MAASPSAFVPVSARFSSERTLSTMTRLESVSCCTASWRTSRCRARPAPRRKPMARPADESARA
eukprot:4918757-Lingulodinium_polyedra.AAC.1